MKILIHKPSSLGDVAQALPVLRLLKLHLPASKIYWWIDTRLSSLLENDPDLEGVVQVRAETLGLSPELDGIDRERAADALVKI